MFVIESKLTCVRMVCMVSQDMWVSVNYGYLHVSIVLRLMQQMHSLCPVMSVATVPL